MNFSEVLDCLKIGKKAYRTGWNGEGQHVAVLYPDSEDVSINQPYLYLENTKGLIFP